MYISSYKLFIRFREVDNALHQADHGADATRHESYNYLYDPLCCVTKDELVNSKSTEQLHLLWVACGTEDRLIDINRKFRVWLASKNVKHVDIETPGMHTWMVWRRNLTEFSSLLFR